MLKISKRIVRKTADKHEVMAANKLRKIVANLEEATAALSHITSGGLAPKYLLNVVDEVNPHLQTGLDKLTIFLKGYGIH